MYGPKISAMETDKRGRGRPPVDDPEDQRLEIRLTKARRKAYDEAANRKGLPTGTWAKRVLDRASKR